MHLTVSIAVLSSFASKENMQGQVLPSLDILYILFYSRFLSLIAANSPKTKDPTRPGSLTVSSYEEALTIWKGLSRFAFSQPKFVLACGAPRDLASFIRSAEDCLHAWRGGT